MRVPGARADVQRRSGGTRRFGHKSSCIPGGRKVNVASVWISPRGCGCISTSERFVVVKRDGGLSAPRALASCRSHGSPAQTTNAVRDLWSAADIPRRGYPPSTRVSMTKVCPLPTRGAATGMDSVVRLEWTLALSVLHCVAAAAVRNHGEGSSRGAAADMFPRSVAGMPCSE